MDWFSFTAGACVTAAATWFAVRVSRRDVVAIRKDVGQIARAMQAAGLLKGKRGEEVEIRLDQQGHLEGLIHVARSAPATMVVSATRSVPEIKATRLAAND